MEEGKSSKLATWRAADTSSRLSMAPSPRTVSVNTVPTNNTAAVFDPSWRRRALQRHQYLTHALEQSFATPSRRSALLPGNVTIRGSDDTGPQRHVTPSDRSPSLDQPVNLTNAEKSPHTSDSASTRTAEDASSLNSQSGQLTTPSSVPSEFLSSRSLTSVDSRSTFDKEAVSVTGITCSSAHECTQPAMSLFVPLSNNVTTANVVPPKTPKPSKALQQSATAVKQDEAQPKKSKVFDTMLSAINRKKNKSLPVEEPSKTRAETPDTAKLPSLTTDTTRTTLISPEPSLHSAHSKSPGECNKLQPRSGRIELSENHSELHRFFEESRVRPEEPAPILSELKSAFDWDSDDERDSTKKTRKIKEKEPPLSIAPKKTASADLVDNTEVQKRTKLDEHLKIFAERFAPHKYDGSPNAFKQQQGASNDGQDPLTTGGSEEDGVPAASQSPALSRKSALLKRSSVLKLFNDPIWKGESVTGYDFNEREFSTLSLGDIYTYPRVGPTNPRPTALATSTSMPSLTGTPNKNLHTIVSEDITTSPSKSGLSASNVDTLPDGATLSTLRVTQSARPHGEEWSAIEGDARTKVLTLRRKFKSELMLELTPSPQQRSIKAASPRPTFLCHRPMSSPVMHDGQQPPKTSSPLKHGSTSSGGECTGGDDPFLDQVFPPTTDIETRRPSHGAEEKNLTDVKPMAATSSMTIRSPTWTVVPSPTITSMAASSSDPDCATHEQPNSCKANPATAIKEASDTSETATEATPWPGGELHACSPIRAARDIILLGIELGLTPRKAVPDLTEEDIEVVGDAMLSRSNTASVVDTGILLGIFFRKMSGGDAEKEACGEKVRLQIQQHPTLHLAAYDDSSCDEGANAEQLSHWADALEYLASSCAVHPSSTRTSLQLRNHSSALGLGITTTPVSSVRTRQSTPMDFALLRPMSTIAETDHAHVENIEDNRSRSSTYTVDEINQDWRTSRCEAEGDELPPYTCEEAIPLPLSVPKRRRPPLDLPTLKVPRDPATPPSNNAAFSPERNSSFMCIIREASSLKDAQLDRHPALCAASPRPTVSVAATEEINCELKPLSKRGSLDSAFGLSSNETHDDSSLRSAGQWDFAYPATSRPSRSQSVRESQLSRSDSTTLASQNTSSINSRQQSSYTGRLSGNIDVQQLRRDLGMEPLKLPLDPSVSRHPHHPFTWEHEKIMCRFVHNIRSPQPPLPPNSHTSPTSLRHMESIYFTNGGPAADDTEKLQTCPRCGKRCCRFATMLVESQTTSPDLAESAKRLKALNRLSMLRSSNPNGIEEYEIFVDCGQCGDKVCPDCAMRCRESLCQAIFCLECSDGLGRCPVHNFF